MEKMNGATYIAEWIKEQGVTHVFGITGGPIVPLFKALKECEGLKIIMPRHEQGGVFMADGYARVSKNMGVCCVTTGPGTANAFTGIYSAYMDHSPVLLVTGQTAISNFGRGGLQDSSGLGVSLDSVAAFKSITKISEKVVSAKQLSRLLSMAWLKMKIGSQGTAHLSMAADILSELMDEKPVPLTMPKLPAASKEVIRKIKNILLSSKNPVILAGYGVKKSSASKALIQLAEYLQAPVATTLKGKGAFPENHPLALGTFSTFTSHGKYLLSPEVDVLLVLGSQLGETATAGWRPELFSNRMVIQVDIDPSLSGWMSDNNMLVTSDVGSALELLLNIFKEDNVKETGASAENRVPSYYDEKLIGRGLNPRSVISTLSKHWPCEGELFVDAGNCLCWVGDFFQARDSSHVHIPIGSGTMGASLPMAIGGKAAAPKRKCIVVMGDGAFMMTGMELSVAVENNLPVIVIVLNNGGHGTAYAGEKLLWGKEVFSKFDSNIDIAAIARAMGAEGKKIYSLDSFYSAFLKSLTDNCTTVLDVILDIDEIPGAIEGRINTLRKYFEV